MISPPKNVSEMVVFGPLNIDMLEIGEILGKHDPLFSQQPAGIIGFSLNYVQQAC